MFDVCGLTFVIYLRFIIWKTFLIAGVFNDVFVLICILFFCRDFTTILTFCLSGYFGLDLGDFKKKLIRILNRMNQLKIMLGSWIFYGNLVPNKWSQNLCSYSQHLAVKWFYFIMITAKDLLMKRMVARCKWYIWLSLTSLSTL